MIREPAPIPVEPVARPGDPARPGRAGPVRVGLRARPTGTSACAATSTRASRTGCPAPTSTRSTSCGRCRTPRPGYGFPESGQTIVNVTNGKLDPAARRRRAVRRALRRAALATSGSSTCAPARCTGRWSGAPRPGAGVRVRTHPAGLVHPARRSPRSATRSSRSTAPLRLILQSELVANEQLPPQSQDPRVAAVLDSPLQAEEQLDHRDGGAARSTAPRPAGCGSPPRWSHEVRRRRAGTAVEHRGATRTGPRPPSPASSSPGEKLRVVKFVAYGWSSQRSLPALRDQVGAALAGARLDGWDGLLRRAAGLPRRVLGRRRRAGRGRPGGAAGGPVRALPRAAGRRPGRAAADRGEGPDRPRLRRARVLGHRDVRAAGADLHPAGARSADALRWRHSTLDLARERARTLGLRGAAFPWRTIRGQECSAYWPAGTAGFHIAADIADAVRRYVLGHRRRATSSARSGWSCWWRPPGCGARWATTTGTAGSTSTG